MNLLRRWLVLSLRGGFDGFHPSRQNAPREQHLSPAAQALKPDVCTQADDFPFKTAAGMGLAQTHPVVKLQVRQHRGHYNMMESAWVAGYGWYNPSRGALFPMLLNNLVPSMVISYLFVLLIAFTVHEFAHAWTATYFGDDTPRQNGRLTLNPLKHLDPIGSILLLVAGFGWAKPVPVNPYALQRRSSAALMWVSLAGPLSNFLMAAVVAIPFRLGLVSSLEAQISIASKASHFWPTLPQIMLVFIQVNLFLMLFNLIPLPPLDGSKIAEYIYPPWGRVMDMIGPFSMIIILAIAYIGVLTYIIGPPLQLLMRLLVG